MDIKVFKFHGTVTNHGQPYMDFIHIPPANAGKWRGEAALPSQTSYSVPIQYAVIEKDGIREEIRFCVDDPVISQIIYNTTQHLDRAYAENTDLRDKNRHLSARVKDLGDEVAANKQTMNSVEHMNIFQLISWWKNMRVINRIVKGKSK